METPVLTKICPTCPDGENVKPISAFGKHKRGKNGVRSTCKACNVKATQARYTPRPRKFYPVIGGKKECSKCHAVKKVEEFPPDSNPKSKTGVVASCKTCAAKATADWREIPGNTERGQQACGVYYASHKKEIAETNKRYRAANPELVAEWNRRKEERRKNNPAKQAYHRRKTQAWERAHPENVRQRAVRRYGRKKNIPQIDVVDVDVLYARDKAICSLCMCFCLREDASQDHIVPITKPASEESYANSALAHIDCNRRKNNKINLRQMLLYYKGDPEIKWCYLTGTPLYPSLLLRNHTEGQLNLL